MISIDPGVNGCGVAEWCGSALRRAVYVPVLFPQAHFEKGTTKPFRMAAALDKNVSMDVIYVIERPQIYTHRKTDPNDLLSLIEVAGMFCGMRRICPIWVSPHSWKGNIDPNVCIERIQERLTKEETARVDLPSAKSLRHNVWDAVGIGLHHLNRLRRERIIHR